MKATAIVNVVIEVSAIGTWGGRLHDSPGAGSSNRYRYVSRASEN